MRRIFLSLALVIGFGISNLYAAEDNLYGKFKGSSEIKVFVEDAVNEAEDPAVRADVFRNTFKDTLVKRQGMRFTTVDSKDVADIVISARIKSYILTENAMPFLFSAASVAADTLSPKTTGKITVDYAVKSSNGKILLSYKNFTTEERRPRDHMKGDAAFIHSVEKSANRFIHKSFYKPNDR